MFITSNKAYEMVNTVESELTWAAFCEIKQDHYAERDLEDMVDMAWEDSVTLPAKVPFGAEHLQFDPRSGLYNVEAVATRKRLESLIAQCNREQGQLAARVGLAY